MAVGGLFASPERMNEAASSYSDFSENLFNLIGQIDLEIKAVEDGAMAGDSVRRLCEEYQHIRNTSLTYANKLVSTAELLRSIASEREDIGNN